MYENSIQAEDAFYSAFVGNDIQGMMAIWDNNEDVTCVHPGGLRLQGRTAIEESWNAIFSSDDPIDVYVDSVIRYQSEQLTIHQVREHISVAGAYHGEVLAMNVYRKTREGWKMVSHHASGAPPDPALRADVH